MMKFRKRPIEVEAMRWDGSQVSAQLIIAWAGKDIVRHLAHPALGPPMLEVMTFEGTTVADAGDWIIKGSEGEFYPVKPQVFAKTYDMVVPPLSVVDTPNYLAMKGPELLKACGDNATKWAAAYCQHARERGELPDQELVMGWFANAIEQAYALRPGRKTPELSDAPSLFAGGV